MTSVWPLFVALVIGVIGAGCGSLSPGQPAGPGLISEPIALTGPQEPLPTSLDRISALAEGRTATVALKDGRIRDVERLKVYADSVSYVVVPGDWSEATPVHRISSITLARNSRWKGAFQGGRLGLLIAAIVGPAAEYWAGARGGALLLSFPVYGALGLSIGAPVGAFAGLPEVYRFSPVPSSRFALAE